MPADLSSERANPSLCPGLNEQAQSSFHGGPLGPRPAAAHGLAHQAVVNVDAGSHFLKSILSMCKYPTLLCMRQRPAAARARVIARLLPLKRPKYIRRPDFMARLKKIFGKKVMKVSGAEQLAAERERF
jgi:hypothetical protein